MSKEKIKNNILLVIIILLMLSLCAVISYFVIDKINASKKQEQNELNTINNIIDSKNSDNIEEIINYSKNVKLPEAEMPFYMCGGPLLPLEEKDVNVDELDNRQKLDILASELTKLLPDSIINNEDKYLNYLELNFDIPTLASRYFDNSSELVNDMADGFGNSYRFMYKDGKSYVTFLPGGCEGCYEGAELVLKSKNYNNDYYIVSYYHYYRECYHVMTYNIYKNRNDDTPLYYDLTFEEIEEAIDYSKLDTYDLYFNIKDGNMKFEKMVYNKSQT